MGDAFLHMTVQQLINKLHELPHYAKVWFIWDGAARSEADHVWLAKSGDVVIAEADDMVYYDDDRPMDAPFAKDAPYWRTPKLEYKEED